MLIRCNLQINKDNTYSIQEHPHGRIVLWNDLLPLLREARYFAQFIVLNDTNPLCVGRAKAFLDATAAIEEEKGVKG